MRRTGLIIASAVLAALDVPVDSQLLVFSKTSLQFPLISPTAPRALYFNDQCWVGLQFDPGADYCTADGNTITACATSGRRSRPRLTGPGTRSERRCQGAARTDS